MCRQCEIDGDHGQPCPEHEALIDAFEAEARLGEEALETFYAARRKPAPEPLTWGQVAADPDLEIPF
jgi:hypothetical protein